MTGDGVAHARRSADAGNDDAHDALPVVIIGAGPGGLTAALELLRRSSAHRPIIIEALDQVGGLARTVRHRGNGLDIGGHRFFSKVSWVTNWWREILPLSAAMEAWRPGPDPSANLAAADALYLALAEQLGASLLTDDHRLTRAPTFPSHVLVLQLSASL